MPTAPSPSGPSIADNPASTSSTPRSKLRTFTKLRSLSYSAISPVVSSNFSSSVSQAPVRNRRSRLDRSTSSPAHPLLHPSSQCPSFFGYLQYQSQVSQGSRLPRSELGSRSILPPGARERELHALAMNRTGSAPNGTQKTSESGSSNLTGHPQDQMPTIRFIPHQDIRSPRPSLAFPATQRTLPHEDCVIRVGRYSERDTNPNPPPNIPSSAPVGFKSKVVSRRHCEFWCSQGQWYIKDVKSSSGTFLNHIRLSQPNSESKPFPVQDGDVVQLGIDFRGGEEMIFRCVKIRVECNRAWQKTINSYK